MKNKVVASFTLDSDVDLALTELCGYGNRSKIVNSLLEIAVRNTKKKIADMQQQEAKDQEETMKDIIKKLE